MTPIEELARKIRVAERLLTEIKNELRPAIEALLEEDDEAAYVNDLIGPAIDPEFVSDESIFDPQFAPHTLEVRSNGKVHWKRTGAKVYTKDKGRILKLMRHSYKIEDVKYAIAYGRWP